MQVGRTIRAVAALAMALLMALPAQPLLAAPSGRTQSTLNGLSRLEINEAPDTTVITIHGDRAPTFTTFRLERPLRVFVDIARADVTGLSDPELMVDNGVIRSVVVLPFRRRGAIYGRVVVTFERDALFHVRADGTAIVVVVDGSDRRLSSEQTRRIAADRQAAHGAAAREKKLLQTLRAIRVREQQASAAREQALTEQRRLRDELAAVRGKVKTGKRLGELQAMEKGAHTRLEESNLLLRDIQGQAASLRKELKREQDSLTAAVVQRRAEEARIALLRQKIARERKEAGKQDSRRINELQKRLGDARTEAQRLRDEVRKAHEVRRTAQAEEVARLKADIARRNQALEAKLRKVGARNSRTVSSLRAEVARSRAELTSSQRALAKSRKADLLRARAQRMWREAEARAAASEKALAKREQQLQAARQAMAEISRQETAARARASQIGDLLQRREKELHAARTALKTREAALAAALEQARAQEIAAQKAGRQAAAKTATSERKRLEGIRSSLQKRFDRQNSALESLRTETQRNAIARQKAEREAGRLRTRLAEREKRLDVALTAQRKQSAAQRKSAQQKIASLQREVVRARDSLRKQVTERERQLDEIEVQLGRRLAVAKAELVSANKAKLQLEKDLREARNLAAVRDAERKAAERLAQERAAQLANARTLASRRDVERQAAERTASEAVQRAERVASLLTEREQELRRVSAALQKRQTVLAAELKRAAERERAALRAGRKLEAAEASRHHKQLTRERGVLQGKLSAQARALSTARQEANHNATARRKAEKEADRLRAELDRREKALAALADKASRNARYERTIRLAERKIASVRGRLKRKLKERERRLGELEATLTGRVAEVRKELDRTRQTNKGLEERLAKAERLATTREAELERARHLAATRDAERKAVEKQAAEAGRRAEKEASTLRAELARREQTVARLAAEQKAERKRAERQTAEAAQRAERVASLLREREQQLKNVSLTLAKRQAVLDTEFSKAARREEAALRAGHKTEAAQAARHRKQLAGERNVLRTKLKAQKRTVAKAHAEAERNDKARRQAEREATQLRAELKQREQSLVKLSARASRSAQTETKLVHARRQIKKVQTRLVQQLAQRDRKLGDLEAALARRVRKERAQLIEHKRANQSLEAELASARKREESEHRRAEVQRIRAERVAGLLSQRERQLEKLRDELTRKKADLGRRLAHARANERKAVAQGRSKEARRAAAERGELEASLESLRGDVTEARTGLVAARAEANKHAFARKKAEHAAAKLASRLRAREAELARLQAADKRRDRKAIASAQQQVAAARDKYRRSLAERDTLVQRFEGKLKRRVEAVRAELAARMKQREEELTAAHESELRSLRKQTESRVAALQRSLKQAEGQASVAKRAGKRQEARRLARETAAIRQQVGSATRVLAARDKAIAEARTANAREQAAREAAEARADRLAASLQARRDELSNLQRDRKVSVKRVVVVERSVKATRRKLESARNALKKQTARAEKRLERELTSARKALAAEFAAREKLLKRDLARREATLRTALAAETDRRQKAERLAASRARATKGSSGGGALNDFARKQQTRIAVLEARAAREREGREAARRVAEQERKRVTGLQAELAAARQVRTNPVAAGYRISSDAAARVVAEARRRDAKRAAARQQSEERLRLREQALLERMRARGQRPGVKTRPVDVAAISRIVDLKITSEGGRRGEITVPMIGKPDYEVLPSGDRRLILRLGRTRLPRRLQRIYDTRALRGPIEQVTAYMPQNQPDEVRLVVDLIERTSNVVTVRDGHLVWTFVRTGQGKRGGRARPGVWAAGGVHARAPQPLAAPRGGGGGLGTPEGAGMMANPIRTPWRKARRYTGRRINLTIKDANIHHVLTFLAKEGNVNIVAGPEVAGKVSFHLENIPWDLALDVILKARGLGYRRQSGVIRVSTLPMLQKEFDAEIKKRKALQEVKQLVVRIIPVNYGNATALTKQVKEVLSKNGTVTVDPRTNALIVKDTEEHVVAVEEVVRKLDAQTPQVLVEARIVEASSNFTKDVGIQWGGNMAAASVYGNETGLAFPSVVGVAGGADGATPQKDGVAIGIPNYAVNMPAAVGAGSGGAIGLTLGSLGGSANLNLRLSAAENEGTVKIVSSPKVVTLDNKTATISQGISIPISVVSAQGVQTRFFNADLELRATPHITQDGNVLMTVNISKNEPDFSNRSASGDPTITKREASTELLLGDGETTVIGGIYTRSTSENIKKVPFFGDLPLIGGLFRSRSEEDKRSELLIFITPRIVNRAAAMTVGK